MTEFEVVRSEVDGWDVRRVGEAQALSNHASREEAEEAARRHSDEGAEIDVRQDVFSEGPGEDLNVKRTMLSVTTVTIGVILLIAAIALAAALLDFGA